MILKLTAPPSAAADSKASRPDAPPQGFVPLDKPSPSAAPVSFIQASEILDQSTKEPEGGQPSTVPATGATETNKGKQGGAGVVLGDKTATSSKADGTAASAVEEPIDTTVKEASGSTTEPSSTGQLWQRRTMTISEKHLSLSLFHPAPLLRWSRLLPVRPLL